MPPTAWLGWIPSHVHSPIPAPPHPQQTSLLYQADTRYFNKTAIKANGLASWKRLLNAKEGLQLNMKYPREYLATASGFGSRLQGTSHVPPGRRPE